MSSGADDELIDMCFAVEGQSTEEILRCVSKGLKNHSGSKEFSRNVLLVYSAGKVDDHAESETGKYDCSPMVCCSLIILRGISRY